MFETTCHMESSHTTFNLNNARTNTEHMYKLFFLGFKNSSVSFVELAEEKER